MSLNEGLTFYDILDISSDASPQDVREAYIRTKATYTRDSVALYTLISPEEREEILKHIEEAYHVLSDPEKRRQYDQNYGQIGAIDNPFAGQKPEALPQNVISIDRVPPMEHLPEGEDFLIPPSTDFNSIPTDPSEASMIKAGSTTPAVKPPENPHEVVNHQSRSAPSEAPAQAYRFLKENRPFLAEVSSELLELIEQENEWKGPFLRKVRDAYKISIEEMAGITKVTKTYLLAIEEENYAKLPAAVYIRGFVVQMAKVLRLPHEKVATAYLSRYYRNRP